jgi:ribokinase
VNIVVVGSLNMDLVVRMPQIPRPGETLLGGVFKTFPGGKGANQAVAAARLGAQVSMVGRVGDDAFGREMLATLAREGIDTTHVLTVPDEATGVALIQVDAQGQNTIAVASRANFRLTGADVEKAMATLSGFEALVMPLETPLETIYAASKCAARQGAKVLLNPAPAQALEKDLLQLVDVLVPNEHELALMTASPLHSAAEVHQAAARLLAGGPRNLVVTLGSQGAMLFSGPGAGTLVPACPVQAVDSTAAGDCFVGALAVGLCEGKTLLAAAEFASAAAAISVTRSGAQPSLPRRTEVAQFIRERNRSS